MATPQNIKLGYLRHPESHEMFAPYTHASAVLGLSSYLEDHLNLFVHKAGDTMTGALTLPSLIHTGDENLEDSDASLFLSNGHMISYGTLLNSVNISLHSLQHDGTNATRDGDPTNTNNANAGLELHKSDGSVIGTKVVVPFSAVVNDTTNDATEGEVVIIINGKF